MPVNRFVVCSHYPVVTQEPVDRAPLIRVDLNKHNDRYRITIITIITQEYFQKIPVAILPALRYSLATATLEFHTRLSAV